jgi:hypothetical protein
MELLMAISINTGRGATGMKGSFQKVTDAKIDGNTVIEYQGNNPKRVGSNAHDRFESYKGFKGSVNDLFSKTECKASDLRFDLERGLVKIVK